MRRGIKSLLSEEEDIQLVGEAVNGRDALEKGPVLVEEFLDGYELSVFVLMDGGNFSVLPPCADFKKAGE